MVDTHIVKELRLGSCAVKSSITFTALNLHKISMEVSNITKALHISNCNVQISMEVINYVSITDMQCILLCQSKLWHNKMHCISVITTWDT